MAMTAYYNEIDPYAAQWLRNLIDAGEIAPGYVDERSIEDVTPDDLRGFTQHHFFAGIGVWSYALRKAGWPDDKPIWTGSCPCQPFSSAGKGKGLADERNLWPSFFHLISECKPKHIFGEQVASSNANPWFDLVQTDLEAMGYAFGIVPFTSAGIGSPHIRERAYWVADSTGKRCKYETNKRKQEQHSASEEESTGVGSAGVLRSGFDTRGTDRRFKWVPCRDGKWRPIEPGTFPLANVSSKRMGRAEPVLERMARRNREGRLKGYGNALNAEAAKYFISSFMEISNA
jgi:DNA (cytosine-5)-methyltransferase 1